MQQFFETKVNFGAQYAPPNYLTKTELIELIDASIFQNKFFKSWNPV